MRVVETSVETRTVESSHTRVAVRGSSQKTLEMVTKLEKKLEGNETEVPLSRTKGNSLTVTSNAGADRL